MSQPNTTSQKPKPPLTAEKNFSAETYLPRQMPSTSTAPTFALVIPFSSNQRLRSARSSPDRRAPCLRSEPPARAREAEVRLGIGQLRPNGLELGVILKRVAGEVSSPAGLLVPSEGSDVVKLVEAVDPNHARLNLPGQRMGFGHISRPNRGRKSIGGAVGNFDQARFVVGSNAREDRAEDFFLGDFHLWLDVREHRGPDEVALRFAPLFVLLTPGEQLRPLLLAAADVSEDGIDLIRADLSAHLGGRIERIANPHFLGARRELADEFIVAASLN